MPRDPGMVTKHIILLTVKHSTCASVIMCIQSQHLLTAGYAPRRPGAVLSPQQLIPASPPSSPPVEMEARSAPFCSSSQVHRRASPGTPHASHTRSAHRPAGHTHAPALCELWEPSHVRHSQCLWLCLRVSELGQECVGDPRDHRAENTASVLRGPCRPLRQSEQWSRTPPGAARTRD